MLQSPPVAMVSHDVPAAFSIEDGGKKWPLRIVPARQECPRAEADDIVVCGRRENKSERLGGSLPDNPTLMDDVGDKLNLRLGPIEIGSLRNGGSRALGLRLRF